GVRGEAARAEDAARRGGQARRGPNPGSVMRGCPSAHDLEGLIEERLGDSESAALARHVDSCPNCQLALERLTQDTLPPAAPPSPPPAPDASQAAFLDRLKQAPPSEGGAGRPAPAPGDAEGPAAPGYEAVG